MKHTLTFDGQDITFEAEDSDAELAARIITDIVTCEGFVNLDIDEVSSFLADAGSVSAGEGRGAGEDRVSNAALEALRNIKDITSAGRLLIDIKSGPDIALSELAEAANVVSQASSPEAGVLWAHTIDESIGDEVVVGIAALSSSSAQSNGEADEEEAGEHGEVKELPDGLEFNGKKIAFTAGVGNKEAVLRIVNDILNKAGFVNLNFDDVKAILDGAENVTANEGTASGDDRCKRAAQEAVKGIKGAKRLMLEVKSGPEITLLEMTEAANVLAETCGEDAQVIWGHVVDEALGDSVKVSIVAAV